jgi:putative ABC transport system permease protein
LIALAWRNIWRHTRRSLITVAAMSLGAAMCMPMMAMMEGMFSTMFDVAITQQTGHVRVEHPDYPETLSMFDTLQGAESMLVDLEALPESAAVTWRAYGAGLLGTEDKSVGAQLIGVDPVREIAVSPAEGMLDQGTWLSAPGQILLGHGMAKELGTGLGDEVVIMTQAADGSIGAGAYEVIGTMRSGNKMRDKQGAWMSLADLQELLYIEDQVHEVVLLASGGKDGVAALQEQVTAVAGSDRLVRSWQQAQPQMAEMLKSGEAQSMVMLGVIFFLAGFGVLNTMLMSVFERTRELGVMMALGTRPGKLVQLIIIESLLLAIIGAVIGGLLGGGLDYLMCTSGINLGYGDLDLNGVVFPERIKGIFDPNQVVMVLASMMSVTVLASLWPAWRASRLNPVQAMKAD